MKKCLMSCSAFLFLCIILSVLTALPCTASAEKKADGKAVISEAYARQDGSIRLVLSGKEKSGAFVPISSIDVPPVNYLVYRPYRSIRERWSPYE